MHFQSRWGAKKATSKRDANETAMLPGQHASWKVEAGMGLLAGFVPLT